MSAIPLRRARTDEQLELLRELVAEIKGLRADLRKRDRMMPDASALLAEIQDYFGAGRFTAGGLLILADSREEFAQALSLVVDMNAPARSRTTALGLLLSKLPGVRKVAERGGSAVYELRGTFA